MKKRFHIAWILLTIGVLTACSQNKEAEWAINNYHRYYKEAQETNDPEKEAAIDSMRSYFARHVCCRTFRKMT